MDPWSPFINGQDSCLVSTLQADAPTQKESSLTFEDNFKPFVSDKLPDSSEYLALLENKLNKLKSDQNVLKQLQEKRQACLQQLLSGLSDCGVTDDLEEPVTNSSLLRVVAPEKQALTQGELVELVRYDQLTDEDSSDN